MTEEECNAIKREIQLYWDNAMDGFFDRVDKMDLTYDQKHEFIQDQIDPETADCFEEWWGDEEKI